MHITPTLDRMSWRGSLIAAGLAALLATIALAVGGAGSAPATGKTISAQTSEQHAFALAA